MSESTRIHPNPPESIPIDDQAVVSYDTIWPAADELVSIRYDLLRAIAVARAIIVCTPWLHRVDDILEIEGRARGKSANRAERNTPRVKEPIPHESDESTLGG